MSMAKAKRSNGKSLKENVLSHFSDLRVPIDPEHLDSVLSRAEREKLSHLDFLVSLVGEQAKLRKERSIERRIRAARFDERKTLEEFDWEFNKKVIDRVQIETLATAEFVSRKENLVFVGLSGVGKSHLMQAIGMRACATGFSVRYITSAALISELTSALADMTLPQKIRRFVSPSLLIIDEFGFDRVERLESTQSATLLYKVIDARYRKGSVALLTNVDFEDWGEYLGDPPLSMALLDRLVHNATILKMKGKSYRAEASKRKNKRTPSSK